ncbi:MAG: selenocysteine-specific elongation factor [Paraglaciecola psychrophila]|jgi:selenocysteine-specific elongation factor
MLVATAGHVDHGKTTLIKALTGVDTDRLAEEKKRGLSIELGFAYQSLGTAGTIAFIDVPGHQKFLANMLAGVAAIDFALLVIAADDGPMPQTLEHLAVLQMLGVKRGAIAITKIDRVSPQRQVELSTEIALLTAATFLAASPLFPVCAHTSTGLQSLGEHLNQCALELPPAAAEQSLFRLAIDRSFIKDGQGIIVTGSVFSGTVTIGQTLTLTQSGHSEREQKIRVRAIHANGAAATVAKAGQRCAINISSSGNNLQRESICRGDWLLHSDAGPPSKLLDTRLQMLPGKTLSNGSPLHIYSGASHCTGRLQLLQAPAGADGAAKNLVRLVLDTPLYAVAGDRFIIRDQSAQHTLGGGVIIDRYGPKRGRASTARLQALELMENSDQQQAVQALLAHTSSGIDLPRLWKNWNLSAAQSEQLTINLESILLDCGSFSVAAWQRLSQPLLNTIGQWTLLNPLSQGISPQQLLQQLQPPLNWPLLTNAIAKLVELGQLQRSGQLLHPPGYQAQCSDKEMGQWQLLKPLLEAGPCPPVLRDLAQQLSQPEAELKLQMQRLIQLGFLVMVTETRYFSAASLYQLAQTCSALAQHQATQGNSAASGQGLFSPAQFRDASGIGRRPTIELLEFFDRCGLTRRLGNARTVVQAAESTFAAQTP